MKKPDKEISDQKKRYVKPELRQVDLRPEEAVLGNCKTAGVAGPLSGNCLMASCSVIGT
jgi:hypothetical protein